MGDQAGRVEPGQEPLDPRLVPARAERFRWTGYAFTEWRIYFDTPIDINVSSGNFSMPSSATPVVYGAGYVDAELSSLDLALLDGAPVTSTRGRKRGISIHLEGPYEAQ